MEQPNAEPVAEEKPGTGVDRTLIRQRLVLTPAERARVLVESARNVATMRANLKR